MKLTFLKKTPLLFFSILLILNSCEKEGTIITEEKTTTVKLTPIELDALELNGIIPESNIVQEYKGTILGKNVEGIFIDDSFISYKELNQQVKNRISAKLFTVKNKITTPEEGKRIITIGVVTSGPQGLDNKQRNAAQTVVHRYKALNLKKLDFEIIIGAKNFDGRPDIVVISSDDFTAGGFDGRGRFPSNGNPGDLIGIHTRTQGSNWPQSELISLLMHELGHTLGLVHGDYKTRRSCISFGLEDAGDVDDDQVDAIADTDTSGDFINSIMRACNFYAIGDFTAEDKKSLRTVFK